MRRSAHHRDPAAYPEPLSNRPSSDPAKWDASKMQELIHSEQRTQDADRRAESLHDAQAYMADQAPYIPLFQAPQVAATSDKIGGVVLDPIQIFRYWLLEKKG